MSLKRIFGHSYLLLISRSKDNCSARVAVANWLACHAQPCPTAGGYNVRLNAGQILIRRKKKNQWWLLRVSSVQRQRGWGDCRVTLHGVFWAVCTVAPDCIELDWKTGKSLSLHVSNMVFLLQNCSQPSSDRFLHKNSDVCFSLKFQ